tara:strand:+ start:135 stop:641 length:507 start_codon:yes stop_codon:yes gene_type:complete
MNKQVGGFMYKNKEQSLETFTMSAENPEFHKRLEVLEETINLILNDDLQKWSYKTSQKGYFSRCKISYGKKFVKIVREEGTNPDHPREVSQFGWVDMSNGDVLMGHNYRSPSESEKRNPRSNIWKDQYGAESISSYGVGYKGAKYNNESFVSKAVDTIAERTKIKEKD